MAVATKTRVREQIFNVPNQLTALRLGLSFVVFVLLVFKLYLAALAAFVIAASTDWVDGYWARKYGQVTTLGRMLDPLVDKIIICGTFIFLVAEPDSGIVAWMAALVVVRELLVTALRNFLEGEGADFSAKMSGKLKMAFQCFAALVSMYGLSYGSSPRPEWFQWTLMGFVWSAVVLTVYSGLEYVVRAAVILRRLAH